MAVAAWMERPSSWIQLAEWAINRNGHDHCGEGPLRIIPLLVKAEARGVLRQAGALWQFRHAELQDRLAARYVDRHPSLNSASAPSHQAGTQLTSSAAISLDVHSENQDAK